MTCILINLVKYRWYKNLHERILAPLNVSSTCKSYLNRAASRYSNTVNDPPKSRASRKLCRLQATARNRNAFRPATPKWFYWPLARRIKPYVNVRILYREHLNHAIPALIGNAHYVMYVKSGTAHARRTDALQCARATDIAPTIIRVYNITAVDLRSARSSRLITPST